MKAIPFSLIPSALSNFWSDPAICKVVPGQGPTTFTSIPEMWAQGLSHSPCSQAENPGSDHPTITPQAHAEPG